jgi:hypothetical protein
MMFFKVDCKDTTILFNTEKEHQEKVLALQIIHEGRFVVEITEDKPSQSVVEEVHLEAGRRREGGNSGDRRRWWWRKTPEVEEVKADVVEVLEQKTG